MPISSSASSRALASSGAPRAPRASSSTSSRDRAEKLLTKLSGFLISWAMPAVSWPSEASFSDWIEPVLRLAQIVERRREFVRARLHLVEQAHVLDRDHGLVGEGLHDFDLALGERAGLGARQHEARRRLALSRSNGTPSSERTGRRQRAARQTYSGSARHRECARPCPTQHPARQSSRDPVRGIGSRRYRSISSSERRVRDKRKTSPSRTQDRARRRAAEFDAGADSVSNTACKSNAERLMTFSTSAVAVCCCSASSRSSVRSCTSSNRRTFSIAITAWSAKVCTSSI